MATDADFETVLAIDVGERRVGVARAHIGALFPQPYKTLENPDSFISDIVALCLAEKAACLVVGQPRNLSGDDTAQTRTVQEFGARLEKQLAIPVYWIDEALTSAKAEQVLRERGHPYQKGEIDALAASFILEDFILTNKPKITELIHG